MLGSVEDVRLPIDQSLVPETQYRVNSIINGDCLGVLSHIKDNAVDLVTFSPPYDSIRDYKSEWRFDYTALGQALYRVTKDGGICSVVVGDGTKDFAKSLTTARLTVDWCDNAGGIYSGSRAIPASPQTGQRSSGAEPS